MALMDAGYARLANVSSRTFFYALGIAALFAIGQTMVMIAMTPLALDNAWPMAVLFVIVHALFIVMVACSDGRAMPATGYGRTVLQAGALLAAPIALFAFLDTAGANYTCADGGVVFHSIVPLAPWLWIGWLAMTFTALPERLIAWVQHERLTLVPPLERALMMAPFLPLVLFLGILFQVREADCTQMGLSFGLTDGGLYAMPLYAVFLFVMSWSMSVLSASFRITSAPRQPAPENH
jgi:hypothetical protein